MYLSEEELYKKYDYFIKLLELKESGYSIDKIIENEKIRETTKNIEKLDKDFERLKNSIADDKVPDELFPEISATIATAHQRRHARKYDIPISEEELKEFKKGVKKNLER